MSASGKAFDFSLFKRVFGFVKPHRRVFNLTVLLTILLACVSPLRPVLTQITIDNYIVHGDKQSLLNFTLLMLGLLILQSLLQFLFSYYTNVLGQNVIRDLRVKLFAHISKFNLKYFDRTPIGIAVTRLVSDMETIADIFSDGLLLIISDILQMIGMIAFMFYLDWKMSLISLSTIPLLIIATRIFQKKIKATFNDVRNAVAALNSFVQEHLTGMRIVQIFNREDEEMKRFEKINRQHRDANIRSVWYYSIFFPVVEILSAIAIGLLVWWGAPATLRGEVTFGAVVAFIQYINMLFRPIRELADKFNTLQMGMVSSERIFKLLDEKSDAENTGKLTTEKVKGSIRFENVWFAYNDESWVLRDVSFTVKPGEMIALVGATGAGKTSIINLLNRFYEIQKGNIFIDDINIKDYELGELRKVVGLVQQDVFLFSDTIANNISLKNPEISFDKIKTASEKVGAHRFIERLPEQYDYNVQERGNMLSVGQRQLLAFIRAYVYQPKILILDEATSSLDTESEEMITEATEKLTSNRTSIVIAHRLSTIQKADNIIVLDHGQIKEQGNHESLLAQNGIYKKLYEIQFKQVAVS
ncbi:MAG: ABC transporter ATP-binding protein [Bacteroidia bacterium]